MESGGEVGDGYGGFVRHFKLESNGAWGEEGVEDVGEEGCVDLPWR